MTALRNIVAAFIIGSIATLILIVIFPILALPIAMIPNALLGGAIWGVITLVREIAKEFF